MYSFNWKSNIMTMKNYVHEGTKFCITPYEKRTKKTQKRGSRLYQKSINTGGKIEQKYLRGAGKRIVSVFKFRRDMIYQMNTTKFMYVSLTSCLRSSFRLDPGHYKNKGKACIMSKIKLCNCSSPRGK